MPGIIKHKKEMLVLVQGFGGFSLVVLTESLSGCDGRSQHGRSQDGEEDQCLPALFKSTPQ